MTIFDKFIEYNHCTIKNGNYEFFYTEMNRDGSMFRKKFSGRPNTHTFIAADDNKEYTEQEVQPVFGAVKVGLSRVDILNAPEDQERIDEAIREVWMGIMTRLVVGGMEMATPIHIEHHNEGNKHYKTITTGYVYAIQPL